MRTAVPQATIRVFPKAVKGSRARTQDLVVAISCACLPQLRGRWRFVSTSAERTDAAPCRSSRVVHPLVQ
jgi:hypothetical protein